MHGRCVWPCASSSNKISNVNSKGRSERIGPVFVFQRSKSSSRSDITSYACSSPKFKASENKRSGAPGSFNIDDSIPDLVKALDNLCKVHALTTQDLLKRLDRDNQQKLGDLLTETRKILGKIGAENKTAGRQEQVDLLNVVLSRVANVTSQSRDFGSL
jgi:hypothetical protein